MTPELQIVHPPNYVLTFPGTSPHLTFSADLRVGFYQAYLNWSHEFVRSENTESMESNMPTYHQHPAHSIHTLKIS